jgi:hypothetical protein
MYGPAPYLPEFLTAYMRNKDLTIIRVNRACKSWSAVLTLINNYEAARAHERAHTPDTVSGACLAHQSTLMALVDTYLCLAKLTKLKRVINELQLTCEYVAYAGFTNYAHDPVVRDKARQAVYAWRGAPGSSARMRAALELTLVR